MEVENLEIRKELKTINNNIKTLNDALSTFKNEYNTFKGDIKSSMKYLVPLKLYSGTTYTNSHKLYNKDLTSLSMYDFLIICYQLYNYDIGQAAAKVGTIIVPVKSDKNFSINYRWRVGDNIWESTSEFSINMSNSTLVRNTSITQDSFRPMITEVYGVCDADLILNLT